MATQWNSDEQNVLRSHYHKYKNFGNEIIPMIRRKLPYRSSAAIRVRARKLGLCTTKRRWSENDRKILAIQVSQSKSIFAISKKLGRSVSAVKLRIKHQGLVDVKRKTGWIPEEDFFLINNYSKLPMEKIYLWLGSRHSMISIKQRAFRLGLKRKLSPSETADTVIARRYAITTHPWTFREDNTLARFYGHISFLQLMVLFHRTYKDIRLRAYKLGLRMLHYPSDNLAPRLPISDSPQRIWTDRDDRLLEQYFFSCTKIQLKNIFPHKSLKAITFRAFTLGLKKKQKWSQNEKNKIKKYYPKYAGTPAKLKLYFPDRTIDAIRMEASKLKIKKAA